MGSYLHHPVTGEPCLYYVGADSEHPDARFYLVDDTGRVLVDPQRAVLFSDDGVLVAGCLEGGCHFIEGNLWAKRRVNYIREMLSEIGFEKERLRMVNVSAAMAHPLADIIIDMVETVRKLGPNPLRLNNNPKELETTL